MTKDNSSSNHNILVENKANWTDFLGVWVAESTQILGVYKENTDEWVLEIPREASEWK